MRTLRIALALALSLAVVVVPAHARRGRETVWGVLGPIQVVYRSDLVLDGEWLYGMYEADKRRITIRSGMDPTVTRQTLLHERCHADLADLGVTVGDEDVEDAVCEALSVARLLEERR